MWLEVAVIGIGLFTVFLVFLNLRATIYFISIVAELATYFSKMTENPLQKSLEKVHPLAYPIFLLLAPKILGENAGKVGSDVLERLKQMEMT